MAFTCRLSAFFLPIVFVLTVTDVSFADKDYAAERAAAEHFLTTSPNAAGVWEADEYGTLVHKPSGFTCNPGREGGTLKLIQLNTAGNPIGNKVGCTWDMVGGDGDISMTVTRLRETTLLSELTRNVSELGAKHSATNDGVPMSMGGKPPFALESARLRFLDIQNREMQISIWVYSAANWLVTTVAIYPVKEEDEFPNAEFMGSLQAFGGVASILKIEGPLLLVTEDE